MIYKDIYNQSFYIDIVWHDRMFKHGNSRVITALNKNL